MTRRLRVSRIELMNGYYYGYRPCCVAQFVNDSFNSETALSAKIRAGCARGCGFVACFDCERLPCVVCGWPLNQFYGAEPRGPVTDSSNELG